MKRNEFGELHLDLSKPFFKAGDQLDGQIYLKISKPFPCKSLSITIIGIEKVNFYNINNKQKDAQKQTINHTSYILNQKFPVTQFKSGAIKKGQYQIPFSMVLPSKNLPNTFNEQWYSNGLANALVKYSLKAD